MFEATMYFISRYEYHTRVLLANASRKEQYTRETIEIKSIELHILTKIGFPPTPQIARARNRGHVEKLVNSMNRD